MVQVLDAGLLGGLRLLGLLPPLTGGIVPPLKFDTSELPRWLVEVHLDSLGWPRLGLLALLSTLVAALNALIGNPPRSHRLLRSDRLPLFEDRSRLLLLRWGAHRPRGAAHDGVAGDIVL